MDRSLYVGTLISSTDEQGREVEQVLTEFVGEGSTGIVFAVAPRTQPGDSHRVVKFLKPQPKFELGVLHHSLRIATELYPAHPLAMPPAQRLQRLAAEMQQRIASPGVVFHVPAFVALMDDAVELLVGQFLARHRQGALARGFLAEATDCAPLLDECLARHMETLLEDDAVDETARDLVARCVDAVRDHAATAGTPTLAGVRAYRLLGLHLVDFVSFDELVDLLLHDDFAPPLQPLDVMALDDGCFTLYWCARTLLERQDPDFAAVQAAALQAARLVEALVERRFPDAPDALRARALVWQARAHLLVHERTPVQALAARALDFARAGGATDEETEARKLLAALPPGPA